MEQSKTATIERLDFYSGDIRQSELGLRLRPKQSADRI